MVSTNYPQIEFPDLPLYVGRPTRPPFSERGQLHLHPHYEIVWVSQGEADFFSDFERYSSTAGGVAFIAPGQLHGWFSDWTQLQLTVVGFQPATLGLLPRLPDLSFFEVDSLPVVTPLSSDQAIFGPLFDSMYRHFQQEPPSVDLLVAYLHTLLLEARRVYVGQLRMATSSPAQELTRQFRRLLEHNYAARWQICDYANQLGVTSNHLVKTVRQITGRTPGQMSQQRLYLEARRLLAHSVSPVSEIAETLTFTSTSQFGHWFKKLSAISPAQFRQQSIIMTALSASQPVLA